ncbi:DUF4886 domain-containing protein [Niabella aquatica]
MLNYFKAFLIGRRIYSYTHLFIGLGLLLLTGAASCKKSVFPDRPAINGREIVLDKTSANLMIGEQTIITLSFNDGQSFVKPFTFSSSDPKVAKVERVSSYTIRVTAIRKGTAQIKFQSDDSEVGLTCNVNVDELPPDGITRILAIGNSFSEDAIETYLYPVALAGGDSVIIGNLYIGGSSLEDHLANAKGNKKVYSYRKIDKNGRKVTTENMSIEDVLNNERWDYISFQQVSQLSGQYATYQASLPELVAYVKDRVVYSRTKYLWHQTWAYQQNSTHSGFANYNNNQQTMYQAIVDASQKALTLGALDKVIPAGTAIQNGRSSFWGDNFCRDGYHLDLNVGRYLAACTWYEAIFNKSVVGNSYNPYNYLLSDTERAMAQEAAHEANLHPYATKDLTAYKQFPAADLTVPVFVDVAQTVPVFGWNGLTSPAANTAISFLRNKDGAVTPIGLTLTEGFNNINQDGEKATTTEFNMPASVSGTSYFGNTKAEFGNVLVRQSVIRLTGFDGSRSYKLCFFGSRGGIAEGRQTKYTAKGKNTVIVNLMTGSNKTNIACAENIIPDSNGNIYITITAGDLNDNSTGFYYLNAMRIAQQ